MSVAGNEAVLRAFTRTHCHLHFFRLSYDLRDNRSFGGQTAHEHRAVVEALVSGRPEAAERAMADHLRAARDRLLARL
ncbi:FCD domain-containing protein [Streptomyces sp. M19]